MVKFTGRRGEKGRGRIWTHRARRAPPRATIERNSRALHKRRRYCIYTRVYTCRRVQQCPVQPAGGDVLAPDCIGKGGKNNSRRRTTVIHRTLGGQTRRDTEKNTVRPCPCTSFVLLFFFYKIVRYPLHRAAYIHSVK